MIGHILVVDDEKNIRKTLRPALEEEGYKVSEADSGKAALAAYGQLHPDIVLLDIWMEGMDGLEVLRCIKAKDPHVSVVMMSGHGNIETAVKATKLGAYDFIEKPLSLDKILVVLKNLLSIHELKAENRALRQQVLRRYRMVIGSQRMVELERQLQVAAPTNSWVLITGENGTGKELVARNIHALSQRASRPFVAVNCAAIPEGLIESELFGHEKGAFTGATTAKKGKFEGAHGGTLFLDEVGDMSLKTQAKILRVLQEKRFERVGGHTPYDVDVRVIGATNKNLKKEIREGRFREDLFYRLNVIPFHIHPLRDRKEDIVPLVSHFLREMAGETGKKIKKITREALAVLQSYPWPGNIRELKNLVERIFIMTPSDTMGIENIPAYVREREGLDLKAGDFKQARMGFEKKYLENKLKEFNGNVSKTAKAIGMERTHLHRKMKHYQIEV